MSKFLIPAAVITSILIIILAMKMQPSTEVIYPKSPEATESIKDMISGTWFYNDTTCIGEFNSDSIEEFNFGNALPALSINPVRFLKHKVVISSALKNDPIIARLQEWFSSCKAIASFTNLPVVITHDDLIKTTTFYYFQELGIILMMEDDNFLVLSRLNDLTKLPRYKGVN